MWYAMWERFLHASTYPRKCNARQYNVSRKWPILSAHATSTPNTMPCQSLISHRVNFHFIWLNVHVCSSLNSKSLSLSLSLSRVIRRLFVWIVLQLFAQKCTQEWEQINCRWRMKHNPLLWTSSEFHYLVHAAARVHVCVWQMCCPHFQSIQWFHGIWYLHRGLLLSLLVGLVCVLTQ